MKKITVKKETLISALVVNMAYHTKEFEEDKEKYLAALKIKLQVAHDDIESGIMPNLHFNLPEPKSHTKDYKRTIDMLNMDIEDVVTIDVDEYSKYIEDDWDWKFDFNQTNAFYNRR